MSGMERLLGRREASDAVGDDGWRFLLGALRASVRVGSLAQAADVAARAVAVCGDDADGHLRADLRPDRVVVTLQSLERAALTARDVELAHRISAAMGEAGLPRPQRNRLHFDVCVPHDEAPRRVEAALAAGGRLVSAARAPAFWVLADLEGNEACVTTWQGRDG
jgi:4a-hydroxytetrahydrobiopterin dehydratase